MGNERDYLRNSHEFDKWLKANAILCSIFTNGLLAMVLASLNSAGPHHGPTKVVWTNSADGRSGQKMALGFTQPKTYAPPA